MNTIHGRVTLTETLVGIPDLLIVVYDVDPQTKPEEFITTENGTVGFSLRGQGFPGDRIGSVLTDQNGAFTFVYEDSEIQIRNEKEKRPDLFLMVLSPEEASKNLNVQILYGTSDIRQNAGRSEQYLIRLTSEQLKKAGLSIPSESVDSDNDPDSVIHKVSQTVERRELIKQEIQKIAVTKVTEVKKQVQQIKIAFEKRLVENLSKIPLDEAERFNYVIPGTKVESTVWKTVSKNIESSINSQAPNIGYIVIPNTLLNHFQDNNGNLRDDITSDEIEPFIYGNSDPESRTRILLREDPVSLLCRSQILPDSLQDTSTDIEENGTIEVPPATPPTDGDINDETATPENVPEYIARLMAGITSPEETVAFGVRQRANQDDIQNDISVFELRSGPADVPAFYDFHSLQIAFDYVWQQAIDEDVIELSQELLQQLLDMGGDPLSAMQTNDNPVTALQNEMKSVIRAQGEFGLPENAIMMKSEAASSADPLDILREKYGTLIYDGPRKMAPKPRTYPHYLLGELDELLNEPYSFTVFAAGSTNLGLLTTYRQKWVPLNYQVGDLVKTIPLTPGEERKITSKVIVKKERNIKEIENNLRINKSDTSDTSRVEAEIVRKAEANTNFSINVTGSSNYGVSSGSVKMDAGKNTKTNSQETKKSFREAIIKAAQEYKDDHKIEIESKESFLEENTETATIKNTNDELSVTYLFYELQRRYKVSERIHRLTPVVLVAMEVPNPSRKSMDSLLLTHGWVINRVLLDDTFRAPLTYLSTRMVGDEVALQEMKINLEILRSLVKKLEGEQIIIHKQVGERYTALENAVVKRIDTIAENDTEGVGERISEWWGGSNDGESKEAARLSEEAAKEAYEKAVQEEKELRARLEREVTALNDATQSYSRIKALHLNRKLEIARLRVHIKQNILYYMQAIWSATFKDQIFFELHNVKVPTLTSTSKTYTVSLPVTMPAQVVSDPDQTVLEVAVNVTLDSNLDPEKDFKTLAEIADLDSPMGFKGNYMIFPVKKSNPLTDFMMMPYIDTQLGLHDPDELGNWTPQEFEEYVACLKENLDEPVFELLKGQLGIQYRQLISSPRRAEEEIIVPSNGSLFIEALVGTHPLIEDFKLIHRAIDVKRVQAEVRAEELENVRAAARLLVGEREDPDIEKKIIIEGSSLQPGLNVDDD
ncbi:MAG: hypothetical protein ABIJ16_00060 [Bacteroidota bacterium]